MSSNRLFCVFIWLMILARASLSTLALMRWASKNWRSSSVNILFIILPFSQRTHKTFSRNRKRTIMLNFLCSSAVLKFDIYWEIPCPYLLCNKNSLFWEDLFPARSPNISERTCSWDHTSTWCASFLLRFSMSSEFQRLCQKSFSINNPRFFDSWLSTHFCFYRGDYSFS